MENVIYKRQVILLLDILPEVAKEHCFALHGGTAINLFVRDMPRLSVDIDLTYVKIEDRSASLANISAALERIKNNILKAIPNVIVSHLETEKLLVSANGVTIKLEVSTTNRGTVARPMEMVLCEKAQKDFGVFCVINVVPLEQLYGGKICAALDRQHPRDLFDIKYLLANEGFSDQVKTGFMLCLLSSARPIHEILFPNLLDQRSALVNQFEGMTTEIFSYHEYERTRKKLIEDIHVSLTKKDKDFLLSVKGLSPDWSVYDFRNFPAVLWKLKNLENLRQNNSYKHEVFYNALERLLNSI